MNKLIKKVFLFNAAFFGVLAMTSCAPSGEPVNPEEAASLAMNIDNDGSGNAVLKYAKEFIDPITGEYSTLTRDDINEINEKIVAKSNLVSPERDRVKITDVKEDDLYFTTSISFMRIQYLADQTLAGDLGLYRYQSSKDYAQEFENFPELLDWFEGTYTGFITATNPIQIYSFDDAVGSAAFNPVLRYDQDREIDDFDEQLAYFGLNGHLYKNDKGKMFTFSMCDVGPIESITFTFNGNILAYGAADVVEVTNNSFTIRPVYMDATVMAGSEFTTKNISCFVGFVYYEVPTNWTLIGTLIGVGTFIILFIIFGFVFHWFDKIGYKIHVHKEKKKLKKKNKVDMNLVSSDVVSEEKYYSDKAIKKQKNRFYFKKNYSLYLMLIPALVLLGIFTYVPMFGIIVAFKNYRLADGIWGSEWTTMNGFFNFYSIFTQPGANFGVLMKNTFILAIWKFIFGFLLAIILAVLFSYLRKGLFKKSVQTISYLPYFVSWVVISSIAWIFLANDGGVLNKIITDVFHKDPIDFYNSPEYWVFILTFTSMWKTMGYSTIVYIAAINSIDASLYEAAKIDGAGRLKQLLHVTVPGMYPVIGIQLVFSLGNLVKDDFDQICSMVRGHESALESTTKTIGVLAYASITGGGASSYSAVAAMGILQGLIALILVVASNKFLKSRGIQGAY